MCVRYTLFKTDAAMEAISQALARKLSAPDGTVARYNVTVTQAMPVVAVAPGGVEVRSMVWGLVPRSDRKKPQRRILPNAKAETAAALAVFRDGVAHRRCLVPADGFYEWRALGRARLPQHFTLRDQRPFAFAGIWDPADEGFPESYGILTTAPNALVAPIHQRMPVILTEEMMSRWIGGAPLPEYEYSALTRPLAAELMRASPVNQYVNDSRHEGPQCLAPPDSTQTELALE